MLQTLSLAYSTCPNDTFLFYALAHAKVTVPQIGFDIVLDDVETLNQAARHGRYDITKMSFAALGHLQDRYALLRSGAALGRGCGPLVVARPGFDINRLAQTPVAVPGLWTTAHLLLALYLDDVPNAQPMVFDQVMPAVKAGAYRAGVIIHEGRFTYPAYGLQCLVDLGQWWEAQTGLPIPLGAIAIRRNMPGKTAARIEKAIRASLTFARRHPAQVRPYIDHHAQEMAPDVVDQHIELYVNDFTLDLGDEGRRAVATLFERGRRNGVLPPGSRPLFIAD